MERAFAWYRSKTIFGDSYIPLCRVKIQKNDGKWIEREFKVDSGSDIILKEIDDYYNNLNYTIDDKSIEQKCDSITDEKFSCLVRKINIMIDNYLIKDVPIAFSTKPIRNLLLGRARIFDKLDILFDSNTKHTIFASRDE